MNLARTAFALAAGAVLALAAACGPKAPAPHPAASSARAVATSTAARQAAARDRNALATCARPYQGQHWTTATLRAVTKCAFPPGERKKGVNCAVQAALHDGLSPSARPALEAATAACAENVR